VQLEVLKGSNYHFKLLCVL